MAFVDGASGKGDPAGADAASAFFFKADAQRRALSYVGYTLNQAHGVFLLTGDTGCGKSALMAYAASDLRKRGGTVVSFSAKKAEGRDLFRQIAAEFGLEHYSIPHPELLDTLERYLIKCISRGSRPLLVIDDAERLTEGDLAHITALCDLENGGDYLLQVVLIGCQFPKLDLVSRQSSSGVNHLVASYHMASLTKNELEAYLQAWMRRHNRSALPAMPAEVRDRIFLWSMGRLGRLEPLAAALSEQVAAQEGWSWSVPALDRMLTDTEVQEEDSANDDSTSSPDEQWHVDRDKDRINSGPTRPIARDYSSTLPPLRPERAREAAPSAPSTAPSDQTASRPSVNAVHTPLLALCANEAEAFLLTPLLKALAQASNRCTLLHTNPQLDVSVLNWSKGVSSIVRVQSHGVPSGDRASAPQSLVEQMQFAAECLQEGKVRLLLALNDSDATLALALVANRQGIPVVRVEAGKRWSSSDNASETNQALIDRTSDLLLVSDGVAETRLLTEGIPRERIREVGTLRVDALARMLAKRGMPLSRAADPARARELSGQEAYVLVALSDKSLSTPERLEPMLRALRDVGEMVPVRLLVAPPLMARLERSSFSREPTRWNVAHFAELDPIRSLTALLQARVVVTDSELLQVEAATLKIPCVTLGAGTLWPATLEHGGNRLCPLEAVHLPEIVSEALTTNMATTSVPASWDGKAAVRAAQAIRMLWPRTD